MEKPKKVFLGSDHTGYDLKEKIRVWVWQNGYRYGDCGCFSQESCDYPNLAFAVAKKVVTERNSVGILICGNGTGMSIAANKIKGTRAALCTTKSMVIRAREDNDANILCLGDKTVSESRTLSMVRTFLSTPFSGKERHIRRNRMIDEKSEKINKEIERKKSNIPEPVAAGFGNNP